MKLEKQSREKERGRREGFEKCSGDKWERLGGATWKVNGFGFWTVIRVQTSARPGFGFWIQLGLRIGFGGNLESSEVGHVHYFGSEI